MKPLSLLSFHNQNNIVQVFSQENLIQEIKPPLDWDVKTIQASDSYLEISYFFIHDPLTTCDRKYQWCDLLGKLALVKD